MLCQHRNNTTKNKKGGRESKRGKQIKFLDCCTGDRQELKNTIKS